MGEFFQLMEKDNTKRIFKFFKNFRLNGDNFEMTSGEQIRDFIHINSINDTLCLLVLVVI